MVRDQIHALTSYHVRQARRGDENSLEWIIERFTPLLLLQANYRLRGPLQRVHDPEDLVDEVWIVALQKLGELRARDDRLTPVLLKFLGATLLNKANNLLTRHLRAVARAGPRQPPPPQVEQVPGYQTSVLGSVLRGEAVQATREALHTLSPRDQEILVLRGIEQVPNREVARLLNEQPGTVSKRYRRALEALRHSLPGSLFEELPET